MSCRCLRPLALVCAVALPSSFVSAQNEPLAPPASATQPNLPSQAQPSTSIRDSNTGGDTVQFMRDKTFIRHAAEGGLAEVQLGQLAAEKGTGDDVKGFGQKMVEDHTALNRKMAAIADSLGIKLTNRMNKTDQEEYDKLSTMSGDSFDTQYIAFMVRDHHADLREFRIEANSTTDPVLKEAVTNGARVIHEHMVMIDRIARSKGLPTPAGRGRPAPPSSE
ncbi:DUF4142 domain-containing protein [Edaphobacter bradus]|uniref:DUF4142 domain-containing protein n=1 Tax=Edaphobacter bradus TaxID=2259016 RepID=UPI0021E0AFEC|nr:DUF4142 domain-containing protein [Edaphobacter bradus]